MTEYDNDGESMDGGCFGEQRREADARYARKASEKRGEQLVSLQRKVSLVSVVPLEDFQDVTAYARALEKECAQLSAGSCPHVVGDDNGNPVCGLILNGVRVSDGKLPKKE